MIHKFQFVESRKSEFVKLENENLEDVNEQHEENKRRS